jgi:hypothetical protein
MLPKGGRQTNQKDINLIQITEQNTKTTTVLMPCDSVLRDGFNHTYKITCPYTLECGEWTTFNYTDKMEVWHNNYRCFSVYIGDGWHKEDTVAVYTGGEDWSKH